MPYIVNNEENIFPGINYFFHPKHRSRRNRNASKWCISLEKEFSLAKESREHQFMIVGDNRFSWNVQRENGRLQQIGEREGKIEFIGRFELNTQGNQLHGYPIDHTEDPKQRPNNEVVKLMGLANKLSKREMAKISSGERL